MQDVLINADYWDKKPKMLAAGLGFTNILGVTNADSTDLSVAQAAVQAVSGAWNVGLTCASTSTPPRRAYTSAAPPSQIFAGYGASVTTGSGLPVEFSWPVLPSTVNTTDFQVTLSDGSVVTPEGVSIVPNLEYNERSTVVLVGAFGTPFPSNQGGVYVTKVQVVSDATPMKLIGPHSNSRPSPQGIAGRARLQQRALRNRALRKVSAVGMSATKTTSPYDLPSSDPTDWTGPKLIVGKISKMSTAGEMAPKLFGGNLKNDGVDLYGKAAKFRVRVLTTGGFSPDGIRGIYPTDYRNFFRLVARSKSGKVVRLTSPGKTYYIDGHPLRVLGLADVGMKEDSYDYCYNEDHDNQFDIVLGGSIKAAKRVRAVVIPSTGNGYQSFYNPGGPGTTPVADVNYTSPGPRYKQKIVNALHDPMTVTYVKNSAKPSLKASIRAPKKVRAGKSFKGVLKVRNRDSSEAVAESLKSCLTLPKALYFSSAPGASINRRTVCWSRTSLSVGNSVTYRFRAVATARSAATRASATLRAKVTASGESGGSAAGRRSIRILPAAGSAQARPVTG